MGPKEFFDGLHGLMDHFEGMVKRLNNLDRNEHNSEEPGQDGEEDAVDHPNQEPTERDVENETASSSSAGLSGAEPPSVSDPPADPAGLLDPLVPALAIIWNTSSAEATSNGLPSTKFGGQPDWLAEPQWPQSSELDVPMDFIAQIALHPDDFDWLDGPKMAYLFVTDDEEDPGGLAIWEPFGGENAVIIQPGAAPSWVEVSDQATGPSRQAERIVALEARRDPELVADGAISTMPAGIYEQWVDAVSYDKVGGTPNYFQGVEIPDFGARASTNLWDYKTARPILMITSMFEADVNQGDHGYGVAYISPDQRQGAYLWFN